MKESLVCTRVVNSIKEQGHWAFKIPDMPHIPGAKFNRNKGVDIVAGVEGRFVAIEVKIKDYLPRTIDSFLNLFTPGQIKAMEEIRNTNGGGVWVFFCHYKPNRRASLRVHDLYLIPWDKARSCTLNWPLIEKAPLSNGLYQLSTFLTSIFYEY